MAQVLPLISAGGWPAPGGFPLTPTGNPKVSEVDNPYIQKDEYLQTPQALGMGITTAHPLYASGQLDKQILRATSWANRYCGRWFDTQSIDEIWRDFTVRPFNPRMVNVVPRNGPIQQVNSMYIQVLQFFIQILITPQVQSYLQIAPDAAILDIVPLLSTSGAGTGSPIPAQILDKVPLGKLWVNYTFGFGQTLTGINATVILPNTVYQAPLGYRLWAPTQTVNVYIDSVKQAASTYSLNYVDGIITFTADIGGGHTVSYDATTNESIPEDVKQAVIMLTTKYIAQGTQNPMGFKSLNLNNYSVSFGNEYMDEIKEMLNPYRKNQWTII